MTKTQKKHRRQGPHHDKKHATERVAPSRAAQIKQYSKELSKKFIHDYVLPMTRVIEHRLQRLERSL